tara:strand:+ start:85 stop:603 length:519 start_codon:yes stop_codon:yes gene_type:complete
MKKKKTKKQIQELELEKSRLIITVVFIGLVLFFGILGVNLKADQIVHKFKNPSFSGVNTSSHYLTIENQEFNRKEAIKAEIKAYKEELKREAENTTLARFIRNLESRIFAQLSRQLVDNLFGETPQTEGILELMGNTIEYKVSEDGLTITLKITDSDGNTTEITVPVGSFLF